jgi:flagellar hook-basal body complex protein FliE
MPTGPILPIGLANAPAVERTASAAGSSPAAGEAFTRLIDGFLHSVQTAEAKAGQAVQNLATGTAEDLHTVTLAVTEADLRFRMALEVRNRLIEAYQEVVRIQI